MNDQVKAAEDPTLAALRERANEITAQLNNIDLDKRVLEARLIEINATIEIVLRNGRKKPGPKPGARTAAESGDIAPPPAGDAA